MGSDAAARKTHPVQTNHIGRRDEKSEVPTAVALAAYEVYCEMYGEQAALIEGGCRGGFSVGETIAFLYARSFPRAEWRDRANEVIRGMVNL